MSNILQTIGQGIQKLGDADVQNRLQAFGATMRNDIQGAAALNQEYAARAQRNKELEQARKERLEQERTRKLERGEDRKWSVADMLAAQEYQANQAQVGRDFQASQQEDQQKHAVDMYGIQRQHQVDDRGYLSPLQKAELAGKAQAHVREIDDENIKREAMGLEPLQYNNQLLDIAGLSHVTKAIATVESGGRQTKTAAPQTSPTRQPLNIKNFTPQQAALYSSKGFIADKDGVLVQKDGYSGEAQDTYGRPIYLNEGKVLKPSEVKAMKDMEKKSSDEITKKKEAVSAMRSQLSSVKTVTMDDIAKVGGVTVPFPEILDAETGDAQGKFDVIAAKEFLSNIGKMIGNGSLSNAEGSKLTGEFAGAVDDNGNFKLGKYSEKELQAKLARTRAALEVIIESKEAALGGGKEYSPAELDDKIQERLKVTTAGPAAEKKTTGYTAEQQSLLDKY